MNIHDAFTLGCLSCGAAIRVSSKPSKIKLGPISADVLVCRACEKDTHNDPRIAADVITRVISLVINAHEAEMAAMNEEMKSWMGGEK